jgi:hypothetical protein
MRNEDKKMDVIKINQILKDTAYERLGGREEELQCAKYLQKCCEEIGLKAEIESFDVELGDIHEAKLYIDGEEILCKGFMCAGNADLEAPLYYLRNLDDYSLKQCKGKIVLIDGYMRYWTYQDIVDHGAVGFIVYDGHVNYGDEDIIQRELRPVVSHGRVIPGVSINVKTAIQFIKNDAKTAKIVLKQTEYTGKSRNVVAEIPGETEEYMIFTAHYDSTSLSTGAYDNMSGSIGLLGIAEHFMKHPHRYGLRFIWCGSEERGLLGSKAYCRDHEGELKKAALVINLDMIGCIMGRFIACCTSEDKLVHYIEYLAQEEGVGIAANDGVYSSDSTPFADKGVPAVSFARLAPDNTATIHNRYDTLEVMKAEQLMEDLDFIITFTEHMVNAKNCPVKREIPDSIKEKLDVYMFRKRGDHKLSKAGSR